jgi:hypothetical protein
MRDINNTGSIYAERDVNIIDQQTSFIPFEQCTNEQLFAERSFRKENLRNAFWEKGKRICKVALIWSITVCIISAYLFFDGKR